MNKGSDKILFFQLPGTPSSSDDRTQNIPFAAACIASHVKKSSIGRKYKLLIPNHHKINKWGDDRIVRYILSHKPKFISFSLYLWNIERSFYIASRIKERLPNCVIVVGGPEISKDNKWVYKKEFIDHFVIGEGEEAFVEILKNAVSKRIYQRVSPLNKLSSPYLDNTLKISQEHPVYIESQRGCPFSCTFCYYPKGRKKVRALSLTNIEKTIKKAIGCGSREIIFLDPTFNNHPEFDKLLDLLINLNKSKQIKYNAELKPHLLTDNQIDKINKAGFDTIEVGLQTINKRSQKKLKCIIPLDKFTANIRKFKKSISIRIDLISGIPGENLNDIQSGIRYLLKNHKNRDLYLYHLSVLPGTELRKTIQPRAYQPKPPYYITNNGPLHTLDFKQVGRDFHKLTGETLDPEEDLDELYLKRKRYKYLLYTDKDFRQKDNIELFNIIEFKSKTLSEMFKKTILKRLYRHTIKNPFCTFIIFINIPNIDQNDLLSKIYSAVNLEYDQYINRAQIISKRGIINIRVAFIK